MVSLGKFFQNYLNNRKQRAVLRGSYSNYSIVEPGVPQGSVLGPFSCRKSSVGHMQLTFNGTNVPKLDDQKHLGLMIDSTLSVDRHLNEKFINAKENVGIFKHLIFNPEDT